MLLKKMKLRFPNVSHLVNFKAVTASVPRGAGGEERAELQRVRLMFQF